MHCRDTADVFCFLVQNWLPEATRIQIGLEEDLLVRTARFLGLVHDFGKATALFQSRILAHIPEAAERFNAFFSLPTTFRSGKATPHARASEAILLELGCPPFLASIAGAHHGKPQEEFLNDSVFDQIELYSGNYWGKGQKQQWTKLWEELFQFALEESGFEAVDALSEPSFSAGLLLTGLLTMADWIASNSTYFPLLSSEDTGNETLYPDRSYRAWRTLSLTSPWESVYSSIDLHTFRKQFGFDPNTIQQAILAIASTASSPGIFILEAPMGVGKTEAALAAAEVLSHRFHAGGLFFGLPTQATTNGIFGRLKDWAETQSLEMVHSIRLAHGAAELNEEYQELFSGSAVTEEDCSENGVLVHRWFQGNKQALLADFVIGTVDQLLLAALKQKHVMLRHLGLSGKVVIIDECHAYDAYMNHYLERALAWLGCYHVPVILLSATLPAQRRVSLIQSYLGAQVPGIWQKNQSYPLLTWTDAGQINQQAIHLKQEEKKVYCFTINFDEILDLIHQKLQFGGCAGIILNTVRKAQELAALLRSELPDYTIFLFHAQFLLPDRTEKEKQLLHRLGKHSTPEQREKFVVIGTQVLEQSLDIDFDFLITELCPMDLLLQRIGRLHRHPRFSRPQPLQTAHCAVLDSSDGTFDAGSQAIYSRWLLWRTRKLLPPVISLPHDIPYLVQDVYHWEPEDCLPSDSDCLQAKLDYEILQKDKKNRADSYVILSPEESLERTSLDDWMHEETAYSDASARAAVRDGASSIDVFVMVQHRDGSIHFLPWQQNGRAVPTDEPPCREDALQIARQKLRLPGYFSKKWNIDRVIRELEDQNRSFLAPWQQAPLLKGELVLLLDENLTASLAQTSLRYSRADGLIYQKEETDEED